MQQIKQLRKFELRFQIFIFIPKFEGFECIEQI